MNKILIRMMVLCSTAMIMFSCSCDGNKKGGTLQVNDSYNFDYLLGNWMRTNEGKDLQTYEHWVKGGALSYEGFSYTLRKGDTLSSTNIQLVKINKGWEFQVLVKKQVKPKVFRLTSAFENGFICENSLNEFPKKIQYTVTENEIKALVSDEDREVEFHYERIEP